MTRSTVAGARRRARELRHEIDHFHLPPREARGDPSWAEWHYFNVLSPDRERDGRSSRSSSAARSARDGRVGRPGARHAARAGQARAPLHERRRAVGRALLDRPTPNLRSVTSTRRRARRRPLRRARARARGRHAARRSTVDLVVTPSPGAYFPGATLDERRSSPATSCPALRADATRLDLRRRHVRAIRRRAGVSRPQLGRVARRDVGVGRGARRRSTRLLYGRVHPPDSVGVGAAALRLRRRLARLPRPVSSARDRVRRRTHDARRTAPRFARRRRAEMVDVRGDDTLRVELAIEDATATDTRGSAVERGEGLAARDARASVLRADEGNRDDLGPDTRNPARGKRSGVLRNVPLIAQRSDARISVNRSDAANRSRRGPGFEAGLPSTRSFRSSTTFAALLPRFLAAYAVRSAAPIALPHCAARCRRAQPRSRPTTAA